MLMGGAVCCFLISLPCLGRGRLNPPNETPPVQHALGIVAGALRGDGSGLGAKLLADGLRYLRGRQPRTVRFDRRAVRNGRNCHR